MKHIKTLLIGILTLTGILAICMSPLLFVGYITWSYCLLALLWLALAFLVGLIIQEKVDK